MFQLEVLFQVLGGLIDPTGFDINQGQLVACAAGEASVILHTLQVSGLGRFRIVEIAMRFAEQIPALALAIDVVHVGFEDLRQFLGGARVVVTIARTNGAEPQVLVLVCLGRDELGGFGVGLGGLAEKLAGRGLVFLARRGVLGLAALLALGARHSVLSSARKSWALGATATRSYSSAVCTARS